MEANTSLSDSHNQSFVLRPESTSSVPWPGSTFMIRASSSGGLLTLDSGKVVLARPGGREGSIHWKCTERRGWLHFQNPVSGCYLGHNVHGDIVCSARHHMEWEKFSVRLRPEGGYYLMITHWDRLWKIGFKEEKLAKIAEGEDGGFVKNGEKDGEVVIWEFVKV
ncbi:major facilitator superfamily transporter multidrug resistance protein [Rutstroemia sp. NJR-2017a WRK4]|nr:major facilitator superfamily transporter multidrug resistance protein [Rutstroemia sp. NJR-2017a WRK4]